jgi:hypothetical protein
MNRMVRASNGMPCGSPVGSGSAKIWSYGAGNTTLSFAGATAAFNAVSAELLWLGRRAHPQPKAASGRPGPANAARKCSASAPLRRPARWCRDLTATSQRGRVI